MVQQSNRWRTDMAPEDQTASSVPTAHQRKGDVERLRWNMSELSIVDKPALPSATFVLRR